MYVCRHASAGMHACAYLRIINNAALLRLHSGVMVNNANLQALSGIKNLQTIVYNLTYHANDDAYDYYKYTVV